MGMIETSDLLGAMGGDPRDFVVYVFVPSLSRKGDPIDHEKWRSETLCTMAELFQGATAVEGYGAWRDDLESGSIKQERVSIVASFMAEADWNNDTVPRLGRFLRRMGRETQQGEIGLIVKGQYFPIRDFDDEENSQA